MLDPESVVVKEPESIVLRVIAHWCDSLREALVHPRVTRKRDIPILLHPLALQQDCGTCLRLESTIDKASEVYGSVFLANHQADNRP